jgi:hypothetical protein
MENSKKELEKGLKKTETERNTNKGKGTRTKD